MVRAVTHHPRLLPDVDEFDGSGPSLIGSAAPCCCCCYYQQLGAAAAVVHLPVEVESPPMEDSVSSSTLQFSLGHSPRLPCIRDTYCFHRARAQCSPGSSDDHKGRVPGIFLLQAASSSWSFLLDKLGRHLRGQSFGHNVGPGWSSGNQSCWVGIPRFLPSN